MHTADEYRIPVSLSRVRTIQALLVACILLSLVTLVPMTLASGAGYALLPVMLCVPLLVALYLFRRVEARLRHPPVLNIEGIRVRAFDSPGGYDLMIPWDQVRRIWLLQANSRYLMIQICDTDELVGGHPLHAARLRASAARHGAEFWFDFRDSIALSDRLDQAIRHFSGGRVHLERG
ncbi:hypothetical protein [Actinomadura sp. HBU206391]|uniref:hypothetical protein n=1 Tax=Actinomadura sp. HBU206391 TaxID=2731692 RepID=UPI00165045E7|nr:hypothetical protein [Actinomadura sp. HBU206391]MBC6457607.1 hypothetical protein [Actinomadura sp. HBU206391]